MTISWLCFLGGGGGKEGEQTGAGGRERARERKRSEVKARSGLLSTLGPCEISQSGSRAATGRRAALILSRADPAARRYGPRAARPGAKLFRSVNFPRPPSPQEEGGREEWGGGCFPRSSFQGTNNLFQTGFWACSRSCYLLYF